MCIRIVRVAFLCVWEGKEEEEKKGEKVIGVEWWEFEEVMLGMFVSINTRVIVCLVCVCTSPCSFF